MSQEELFLNSNSLPNPFTKEETYKLLEEIKNGNEKAKELLIKHNIKLVLYEVTNKFQFVEYDKKDLVSIGIIGLINAIMTFDTSKNLKFSTYAAKCIDNKILDFLKKIKKDNRCVSLYSTVKTNLEKKEELQLINTIPSNIDIQEENINREIKEIVLELLDEVPEKNKEIIKMYFGFYNNQKYTQKEIAKKLNVSRQNISLIITKFLKQTRERLKQINIIEENKIINYEKHIFN